LTSYSSGQGGRALFVLHEPGYYRFYGSTIVEMERRGWDVVLAFDRPHKRGQELRTPAGAGAKVRSVGALPGHITEPAATLRLTLDYVRYLEPAFASSGYLRRRMGKRLPARLRFLTRLPRLPRPIVTAAIALGRLIERCLPVDRAVLEFVRRLEADVIVVSPVVMVGEHAGLQTEVIKAGRALGVPVIAGAASWDHLSSKGLLRVVPDAVAVWNDTQAREAESLHRIRRSRIMVTGAQSLDHWFDAPAPGAVETFRGQLGIAPGRRVILLVGSSLKMAPGDTEVRFATQWLAALRASSSPEVRDAFVIVRPHPSNTRQWQDVDLQDPAAVITPRGYTGMPLSDGEVEAFRQALLASSAVVGINTTAMIEAAILRRPVLTVRDASFDHSQQETLHFGYLSDAQNGCVMLAHSLSEHVRQLDDVLSGRGPGLDASDRFVARFVRPHGVTTPATAHLCDAIEQLAGHRQRARVTGHRGRPVATDHSVALSDSRRH